MIVDDIFEDLIADLIKAIRKVFARYKLEVKDAFYTDFQAQMRQAIRESMFPWIEDDGDDDGKEEGDEEEDDARTTLAKAFLSFISEDDNEDDDDGTENVPHEDLTKLDIHQLFKIKNQEKKTDGH